MAPHSFTPNIIAPDVVAPALPLLALRQGAMLALDATLASDERLAAVIAVSGFLFAGEEWARGLARRRRRPLLALGRARGRGERLTIVCDHDLRRIRTGQSGRRGARGGRAGALSGRRLSSKKPWRNRVLPGDGR